MVINQLKDGNYINYDRYLQILHEEDDIRYKLVFRLLFELKLRVSEICGQSTRRYCGNISCGYVIRQYDLAESSSKFASKIKRHCECINKTPIWRSSLPGLKKNDINAVNSSEFGLPSSTNNIRIFGKGGKFAILPIPNERLTSWAGGLFDELTDYFNGRHIKPEDTIFPMSRLSIYNRLGKYGRCINNIKQIHPHALRRSSAIYDAMVLKIPLNIIQHHLRHSTLNQTLEYCRLGASVGIAEYAKLRYA